MHQNFQIGIRTFNMFTLEIYNYWIWKAMYNHHVAHLVSSIILFWIFLHLLLSICFELPDHQVVRPTISKSPLSKAIVFDLPLCPILFNWGREPILAWISMRTYGFVLVRLSRFLTQNCILVIVRGCRNKCSDIVR